MKMFDDSDKTVKVSSEKFHFECGTKTGAVPVREIIKQLQVIAKILEESKIEALTFSFEASEK